MASASKELRSGSRTSTVNGRISSRLSAVRRDTLDLIGSLSEDALNRVHDPLMSPIIWDVGHIASFEDLWIAQNTFGRPPLRAELTSVYDPFTAPRSSRGELPYLRYADCVEYVEAVRERSLSLLDQADLSGGRSRLLDEGYSFELVLMHEMQHQETILQTLQLMTSEPYEAGEPSVVLDEATATAGEMVEIPGGSFELGTDRLVFSYDNERPAHQTSCEGFLIDRTPVTNSQFAEFVSNGGYSRPDLWSEAGREWLASEQAHLPRYWRSTPDGFEVRRFSKFAPLDPDSPVCHVNWFEADAFARYAGKRLPTEVEWERAASWDPAEQRKLKNPWGDSPANQKHANLRAPDLRTAPVGSHPSGASAEGVLDLIGGVWEWTASGFDRYPGFEAFPYREYSEEFFGGPYRVLRGGAWATAPEAVDATFRNWDYPQRSQIFSGLRCAKDLEDGER